ASGRSAPGSLSQSSAPAGAGVGRPGSQPLATRPTDHPRSGLQAPVVDLLAELYAAGTETEIGYRAGRRQTLCVEPAPLASSDGGLAIDPSSVILLTGGARGITAEVALHLARSLSPRREPEGTHDGYPDGARPTLLLAGRSPHPDPYEDPETASLQEPRELKAAIAARMQGEGREIVPIQVEQEYRRVRAPRERGRAVSGSERDG